MKCFVHVGYNPVPREVESPKSAIALAENLLRGDNDDDDPSSIWRIKWRRDELYPDNFYDYSPEQLLAELIRQGNVVLQKIKDGPDNTPLMGESANIFTADLEQQYDQEAEEALDLDIHGEEGPLRRKFPLRKK